MRRLLIGRIFALRPYESLVRARAKTVDDMIYTIRTDPTRTFGTMHAKRIVEMRSGKLLAAAERHAAFPINFVERVEPVEF
jgi:hypothetical protein